MLLQDVERASHVPKILGERVPARHYRMDEVGVARIVRPRQLVEALAEAAQIRSQHDVSPANELYRIVAVRCSRVGKAADLGLARAVPVDGEDGRPGLITAIWREKV